MKAVEVPLVFTCESQSLVGILHRPEQPIDTAIVCVIAGGPQYRAGVGRNMVSMARALSSRGVAVLRFDHRGLGDSAGEFAGFEHTRADIQAAVDCLREALPELKNIVLWGGCDAASGCMMHGLHINGVTSMVLGNPWISTQQTQAVVRKQHYLARLRQASFWRKVVRFEYDLVAYLHSAVRSLATRLKRVAQRPAPGAEAGGGADHWMARMQGGLRDFPGPVLFLISGQSVVSKEFDALLARDRAWFDACNKPLNRRIDLPQADQTFSSVDARQRVNEALLDWATQLSAA
ncbi:MAG: hydrolase 1, exosortase A system-associated [Gammaproteobacteria bacterium]|nr:hydrolase 1, exosortase A system-associated [Gammaproteobacteria bacterium]